VTALNGVFGGTIPVTLDSTARTITFATPNVSDPIANTFTYTISSGLGISTATVNVDVMQANTGAGLTIDLLPRTYDFSYLDAAGANDPLTAGVGTDYFFGGNNNDTYRFAFEGTGSDQIDESILLGKGSDLIQ